LKQYTQLLRNNLLIRRFSTIWFIDYFATWFSNVAIYTLLLQLDASAMIISLVVAMHFIPTIIQAPFSGVVVDRLSPKKLIGILMLIECVMTLMFLTITSIEHIWYLMLFIFIRMSASSIHFAAFMALLPKVVQGKELQRTNEIHSIIWSVTFTAGMAAGGVVVHLFDVYTAFVIDAALFFIGFLILLGTKLNLHPNTKEKFFSMMVEGVKYIKKNPKIIHLMLLHSVVGVAIFDTIVTLLADYYYKYVISIPLAIGLTNAARALGLMMGPLLIGNWINKERLYYLLFFQAGTIILWGVVQKNFYMGLLAMFLVGFATTTLWSYTYAMLQESIESRYLGRVVSYNDMIFMVVTVVTTLFIGAAVDYMGLDKITYILGLIFILCAIYYKVLVQKLI